jgi:hypothetical protein
METTPGHFTLDLGTVAGASEHAQILFAATVNSALPASASVVDGLSTVADDGTAGADANPLDNSATVSTPLYRGIFCLFAWRYFAADKVYDIASW